MSFDSRLPTVTPMPEVGLAGEATGSIRKRSKRRRRAHPLVIAEAAWP